MMHVRDLEWNKWPTDRPCVEPLSIKSNMHNLPWLELILVERMTYWPCQIISWHLLETLAATQVDRYHWYVCRSNKYGSSGQTTELICSTSITYQSLTDKVYKWTFYIRGSPGFADIRGSQSCQMEDGSPGFADIRGSQSQLCLWLRNVNMEVGAGWERCGTSFWELGTLILESSCKQARVVSWLWGGSSRCYFCEE